MIVLQMFLETTIPSRQYLIMLHGEIERVHICSTSKRIAAEIIAATKYTKQAEENGMRRSSLTERTAIAMPIDPY